MFIEWTKFIGIQKKKSFFDFTHIIPFPDGLSDSDYHWTIFFLKESHLLDCLFPIEETQQVSSRPRTYEHRCCEFYAKSYVRMLEFQGDWYC